MKSEKIIDNLLFIFHLAAEGKIDRLDFQIMILKKVQHDMGKKAIAAILAKSVPTVGYRLRRLEKLLH